MDTIILHYFRRYFDEEEKEVNKCPVLAKPMRTSVMWCDKPPTLSQNSTCNNLKGVWISSAFSRRNQSYSQSKQRTRKQLERGEVGE